MPRNSIGPNRIRKFAKNRIEMIGMYASIAGPNASDQVADRRERAADRRVAAGERVGDDHDRRSRASTITNRNQSWRYCLRQYQSRRRETTSYSLQLLLGAVERRRRDQLVREHVDQPAEHRRRRRSCRAAPRRPATRARSCSSDEQQRAGEQRDDGRRAAEPAPLARQRDRLLVDAAIERRLSLRARHGAIRVQRCARSTSIGRTSVDRAPMRPARYGPRADRLDFRGLPGAAGVREGRHMDDCAGSRACR